MSPIIFSAIGTLMFAVACGLRLRWFHRLAAIVNWGMIAVLLLLNSGVVARSVLKPVQPDSVEAGNFYLGVRLLQEAMVDSYLAVIYLAFLLVLGTFLIAKCKAPTIGGTPHSHTSE